MAERVLRRTRHHCMIWRDGVRLSRHARRLEAWSTAPYEEVSEHVEDKLDRRGPRVDRDGRAVKERMILVAR